MSGCVVTPQGSFVAPIRMVPAYSPPPVYVAPQPVYVAPQPAYVVPQPVYGAPGVVVEYAPRPYDGDIVLVANPEQDIVFIAGDTFLWLLDANGHRYRKFYSHGDHRDELRARHQELHGMMNRNGGHLPPPRGQVGQPPHPSGQRLVEQSREEHPH